MTSENIFRFLSRQDLTPAAKLVLIALEGCSGLTVDALVPITGLSRATCYRTVKQLQKLNEIPDGYGVMIREQLREATEMAEAAHV